MPSIFLVRAFAVISGLALVLMIVGIAFAISDQSLRQQAAERQQIINQGAALSQINTRLLNSLAQAALRDNDEKIKQLLEQHGIALKGNTGPETGKGNTGPETTKGNTSSETGRSPQAQPAKK